MIINVFFETKFGFYLTELKTVLKEKIINFRKGIGTFSRHSTIQRKMFKKKKQI